MHTSFSPTRQDVERYRHLRALCRDLNHRIVKTIPSQAYDEVGDAIGILHKGVLVFDSEDMTSVMMDCCLYDWFENGKNLVQRYAETHPAKPGTDESYLLSACTQAKYRVLVVQTAVPDAGSCFEPQSWERRCGARDSDHTSRRVLDDRRRRSPDKLQKSCPERREPDRERKT